MYYHYKDERRHHDGLMMPTLYLMLEVTLLLLVAYMALQFGSEALISMVAFASGIYFVFSCLPRYFRVLERQRMHTVRHAYIYRNRY
jgi:positive regulator of sigma E activity